MSIRTKIGLLLSLVAMGCFVVWLWQREPPAGINSLPDLLDSQKVDPTPLTSPPITYEPGRPVLRRPLSQDIAPIPSHPEAVAFGSSPIAKEREPALVLQFFNHYRERFGSYPTGADNAQFMNALCGGNPQRVAIFPLSHPRFNQAGELLDGWGTPFRFHAQSRHRLEVHSAGPDGEFFTSDDIIVPPPDPSPPMPVPPPR